MVLILASCLLKFQGSNPTFAGCADPEDCNLGRIGAQRLISGPHICVPTRDPCSLRHLSLLAAIVLVGTSQVWFSVLFWGFFFFFAPLGISLIFSWTQLFIWKNICYLLPRIFRCFCRWVVGCFRLSKSAILLGKNCLRFFFFLVSFLRGLFLTSWFTL